MPEELPSLHIDTDWKKQAQEEKRKLVEQEQKRTEAAPPPAPVPPVGVGPAGPTAEAAATRGGRTGRERGELPEASFTSLVQSIVTQVLFYLGDLSPRGGEPQLNLDMAKHQIDTLGTLEDKTKNNLSDDEKRALDAALYEARMRYVAVASQLLGP